MRYEITAIVNGDTKKHVIREKSSDAAKARFARAWPECSIVFVKTERLKDFVNPQPAKKMLTIADSEREILPIIARIEPFISTELKNATGLSCGTIFSRISALKERGLIEIIGRVVNANKYALTDLGRKELEGTA
jgi:uncharacterized membrane protein